MFFTCFFSYFQKVTPSEDPLCLNNNVKLFIFHEKKKSKKLVLSERFFSHKKLRIDLSISAFVIIHLVSQWYLYNIILRPNRVFYIGRLSVQEAENCADIPTFFTEIVFLLPEAQLLNFKIYSNLIY